MVIAGDPFTYRTARPNFGGFNLIKYFDKKY